MKLIIDMNLSPKWAEALQNHDSACGVSGLCLLIVVGIITIIFVPPCDGLHWGQVLEI
jgi:hypothetical protein